MSCTAGLSDYGRVEDSELTALGVNAQAQPQRQNHHRVGVTEVHVADDRQLTEAVLLAHRAAQRIGVGGEHRRVDLPTGTPEENSGEWLQAIHGGERANEPLQYLRRGSLFARFEK